MGKITSNSWEFTIDEVPCESAEQNKIISISHSINPIHLAVDVYGEGVNGNA